MFDTNDMKVSFIILRLADLENVCQSLFVMVTTPDSLLARGVQDVNDVSLFMLSFFYQDFSLRTFQTVIFCISWHLSPVLPWFTRQMVMICWCCQSGWRIRHSLQLFPPSDLHALHSPLLFSSYPELRYRETSKRAGYPLGGRNLEKLYSCLTHSGHCSVSCI